LLEGERGELFRRLIGTGNKVLDLGCRDGALTRHFVEGNDVTGVDVDTEALAAASALGIKTVSFDFNTPDWPVESGTFDAVVAAEVIEHLYFPDQVLERIFRVLRSGGLLVGSVPNAFTLKCRLKYLHASKRGTPLADPMHINQFGWDEFRKLLNRHFIDVRLHPLGKRWAGLRNVFPAMLSYGIGFSARKP